MHVFIYSQINFQILNLIRFQKNFMFSPEYFKHITKLFKKIFVWNIIRNYMGTKSVAENHIKLSDRKVDFKYS